MRRELLACGASAEGQLGLRTGSDAGVAVPEHIIGAPNGEFGSAVIQVACGLKHTVFLAEDGQVWSVGANDDGQLGRGNRNPGSFTIYPVSISRGSRVIQVAAGRAHSLAVIEDGRLYSWGSNDKGQLGIGSSILHQPSPKRLILNEVVQVASGPDHCIALVANGRVYVWGEQHDNEILRSPTEIEHFTGVPIVRIASGGHHSLVLSAGGSVYVWGRNEYGQLGIGTTFPFGRKEPQRLEGVSNLRVVEISAGYSHSILLTKDGGLLGFGSDDCGQIGCGRRNHVQTVPLAIPDLMGSHVTRVASGRCHTIAVVSGRYYSFGLNSSGQLGNGQARDQITPKVVDDLDHVSSIFAGYDQTFILRSGGVPDVSVGPGYPINTPLVLTRNRVHELLEKKDKLELLGLLESVFSSTSSLNGSFLYSDDRRFLRDGYKECGVDMDAVMETFNTLASSSDARQYAELIVDTCQMSIFEETIKIHSAECLRVFLILPWLDAFVVKVTESDVNRLHKPFADRLLSLNNYWKTILGSWYIYLPKRHFNRVVSSLLCGVRTLVAAKKPPSVCKSLLEVLRFFSDLNRKACILPLESFYVNELSDNYCIPTDYVNYKYRKDPDRWCAYPFLLNGVAKGDLIHIQSFIEQERNVSMDTVQVMGMMRVFSSLPYNAVTVRRDHLIEDTMNAIYSSPPSTLLKPLKITFANEEGDDAGGVKKEYFMLLFQQLLRAEYGMFIEDEDSHLVWFNGANVDGMGDGYDMFRIVGKLVGLAVYNNVLVAFPFPVMLYKMLLNQKPNLDDLCELSPVEGKGLHSLLEYGGDDFEEVFCLTFTITYSYLGVTKTLPLKPGGEEIPVNNHNKVKYVELYVKHRLELGLDECIGTQFEHFKEGFSMILKSDLLEFFQPKELMEMVVGNENYDWTEFKQVVKYRGEYHAQHPTILAFWGAFFKLTQDERKKFIQFLMGTTRLPVRGISGLDISIQPCNKEYLPAAHTCSNVLDLPNTNDEEELLRRLRISIEHTEGFTLA